ncbi:nucleotidyltransferase family protein [Metapseudomonas lalkuanensis]|uniref:Nucleotidyltransferase family protein n=1 Tax=Metapseudomonas lalkuanensis TaxID=2604832 RepID=A0A5J6QN14_9GAMM|nr:nucleotidyltransferase family protein [Pseudomonas lalkuanensis]QEY62691.1 nucleotidyltransferase family protein [Pseudomonas lalkuanensis]
MQQLAQLKTLIASDDARMRILRLARDLDLPDCWVAAGFVRSAVWDHLHQRTNSPLPPDIDVIWFDAKRTGVEVDGAIEASLRSRDDSLNWSVKNQARMHLRNADLPYTSAADAMTRWPETATAVAVRLDAEDELEVAAPFGLDDLFNLVVRPTARFETEKHHIYLDRLRSKNWLAKWPDLKVLAAE